MGQVYSRRRKKKQEEGGTEPVPSLTDADEQQGKNLTVGILPALTSCSSSSSSSEKSQDSNKQLREKPTQLLHPISRIGTKIREDDHALILDLMQFFCYAIKPDAKFHGAIRFIFEEAIDAPSADELELQRKTKENSQKQQEKSGKDAKESGSSGSGKEVKNALDVGSDVSSSKIGGNDDDDDDDGGGGGADESQGERAPSKRSNDLVIEILVEPYDDLHDDEEHHTHRGAHHHDHDHDHHLFASSIRRPRVTVFEGVGQAGVEPEAIVQIPYKEFLLVYSGKASAKDIMNLAVGRRVHVTGWRNVGKFGGSFDFRAETWRYYYAHKSAIPYQGRHVHVGTKGSGDGHHMIFSSDSFRRSKLTRKGDSDGADGQAGGAAVGGGGGGVYGGDGTLATSSASDDDQDDGSNHCESLLMDLLMGGVGHGLFFQHENEQGGEMHPGNDDVAHDDAQMGNCVQVLANENTQESSKEQPPPPPLPRRLRRRKDMSQQEGKPAQEVAATGPCVLLPSSMAKCVFRSWPLQKVTTVFETQGLQLQQLQERLRQQLELEVEFDISYHLPFSSSSVMTSSLSSLPWSWSHVPLVPHAHALAATPPGIERGGGGGFNGEEYVCRYDANAATALAGLPVAPHHHDGDSHLHQHQCPHWAAANRFMPKKEADDRNVESCFGEERDWRIKEARNKRQQQQQRIQQGLERAADEKTPLCCYSDDVSDWHGLAMTCMAEMDR